MNIHDIRMVTSIDRLGNLLCSRGHDLMRLFYVHSTQTARLCKTIDPLKCHSMIWFGWISSSQKKCYFERNLPIIQRCLYGHQVGPPFKFVVFSEST